MVDPSKLTGKSRGMVQNICPNLEGGKSPASPASYSPRTGLFYVPTNNLCMDWQSDDAAYIAGTPYVSANIPYTAGPGGHLGAFIAWDATTGRRVWEIKEKFPVWSGSVVTAGDVTFYGTLDGWFKAANARDWRVALEVQGRAPAWSGRRSRIAARTASSTWPFTPASAATGS